MPVKKLKKGDNAPEFDLKNQTGQSIKLSQYKNTNNVVLFFYPKDDTPRCTQEACSFRDNYENFTSKDAVIIGISSDGEASHKHFSNKYKLPFNLLSDENGWVRKLYGVENFLFLVPGRVTFVIDKEGKVVNVFEGFFESEKHVQEALNSLQTQ